MDSPHRDQTHTSGHSTSELDAALDKGGLDELPPNHPKGILGERGFDLYKVDDFEPDLNAGVSQEFDGPVKWMLIFLAMLVFFPVGYWLLWKDPHYTLRVKVGWSVVFAVFLGAVVYRYVLV